MKRRNQWFLIGLGCLIPLQIYFIAVWLPEFLGLSGGLPNIDSRFGYNAVAVNELMKALGPEGIRLYFIGTVLDVFYAASMSLTIYALFMIVQGEAIRKRALGLISAAIPMVYLMLDLSENVGIFICLARYPFPVGGYISWFSFMTTLKQGMPLLAFLYLVVLICIRVIPFKKRARNNAR